jgi:hypothetical protein
MNTFNLINAIALLACILTPAYVLYFLKYHIGANQKSQKKLIDTIDTHLCDLQHIVDVIQTDSLEQFEKRQEQLKEMLHLIEKNDVKFKMHKSLVNNNIDNINVQLDYLSKKSTSDFETLSDSYEAIYKRINSKTFVSELISELLREFNKYELQKQKVEESKKTKNKVGRPRKNNQENTSTKPSDSLESEVVDIMKDKDCKVNRSYNKSNVSLAELENAFKEKYKMTFYGYREKYVVEQLKKARECAYQKAYYLKVKKQKQITKN